MTDDAPLPPVTFIRHAPPRPDLEFTRMFEGGGISVLHLDYADPTGAPGARRKCIEVLDSDRKTAVALTGDLYDYAVLRVRAWQTYTPDTDEVVEFFRRYSDCGLPVPTNQ